MVFKMLNSGDATHHDLLNAAVSEDGAQKVTNLKPSGQGSGIAELGRSGNRGG